MAQIKVAVSTALNIQSLAPLCPGKSLNWGRCDFTINPPEADTFDYWIVYGRAPETATLNVAPENTLYITQEPPSKRIYAADFYAQFHRIVSCNPDDPHPQVTTSFLGLPWYVGLDSRHRRYRYGYDYLSSLKSPEKINKVSVVCSHKAKTEGQRQRLAFLETAKHELGNTIVHFGRGFEPIQDKMDAILPYRFHLVLENSSVPHYWTEKLSDAFLGWSFPIYYGCKNLSDYFSTDCYLPIDITNVEASIDSIRQLVESETPVVPNDHFAACRQKVLDDYNPFSRFAYWVERFYSPGLPPHRLTVRSHRDFSGKRKTLFSRLRQAFRQD